MKVNFGQMGKLLEVFDTDLMTIGRSVVIQLPDGSTTTTDPNHPLYKELPCHASLRVADNIDPNTFSDEPIVTSFTVHYSRDFDVKQGDRATLYKMGENKELLKVYAATVNEPTMSQARQSFNARFFTIYNYEPPEEPEEPPIEPPVVDELEFIHAYYFGGSSYTLTPVFKARQIVWKSGQTDVELDYIWTWLNKYGSLPFEANSFMYHVKYKKWYKVTANPVLYPDEEDSYKTILILGTPTPNPIP